MKLVVAFIKPHRLDAVTLALHEIDGLSGVSIQDVRGFGRGRGQDAPDRRALNTVDYRPRIKLEVACFDSLVPHVTEAIRSNAHTGLRGDGKIYVSHIEGAIRISTGETGDAAV